MKQLKLSAVWAYSWIKGVSINKAITAVQLNDKKTIIMDQLLHDLSLEDSIALFKDIGKEFNELIDEKELEIDALSKIIKDYKNNSKP